MLRLECEVVGETAGAVTAGFPEEERDEEDGEEDEAQGDEDVG